MRRFTLLSMVMIASFTLVGCSDGPGSATRIPCQSDHECSAATNTVFDYCGESGMAFCCRRGSIDCGCFEDGSCDSGLVCDREGRADAEKPGPICVRPDEEASSPAGP